MGKNESLNNFPTKELKELRLAQKRQVCIITGRNALKRTDNLHEKDPMNS